MPRWGWNAFRVPSGRQRGTKKHESPRSDCARVRNAADIGAEHALFQPCHGSAPDIVGQGKANPTATILSGAMMLTWLGERHGVTSCGEAARLIETAVEKLFADGAALPYDLGGGDGTKAITDAVLARL